MLLHLFMVLYMLLVVHSSRSIYLVQFNISLNTPVINSFVIYNSSLNYPIEIASNDQNSAVNLLWAETLGLNV